MGSELSPLKENKLAITEIRLPEKVETDLREGSKRILDKLYSVDEASGSVVPKLDHTLLVTLDRSGTIAFQACEAWISYHNAPRYPLLSVQIGRENTKGFEDETGNASETIFLKPEVTREYYAWLSGNKTAITTAENIKRNIKELDPDIGTVTVIDDTVHGEGTILTATWVIGKAIDGSQNLADNPNLKRIDPQSKEYADVQTGEHRIQRLIIFPGPWLDSVINLNFSLELVSQPLVKQLIYDLLKGSAEKEGEIKPLITWGEVEQRGQQIAQEWQQYTQVSKPNPAEVLEKTYNTEDLLKLSEHLRRKIKEVGTSIQL